MFRLFRKREALKRYLLIFFMGIVSIGMVAMFTPMGGGDTTQDQTNVLASVGGQSITTQDLDRTLRQRLQGVNVNYSAQLVAGLAPSMLDQMIYRRALDLEAQKMGIEVTDAEVLRAAQAIPGLYPNGKFVGDAAFQQVTGMTVSQFLASLRQELLSEKMRAVITDGVQVSPEEVQQEFLRRNAKARIEYVLFDPSKFLQDVPIIPEALKNFYSQNPDRYKVPEERQVRYVLIGQDKIRSQVKVTDAELKDDYAQHLSDYRVPDRVKVARILFKTAGKTPQEVAAIEKTAESVLAQLRAGKDFGDLAGKYSEDASASQGGVVGWIQHGQAVKAFEDAAFSLQPGQISALIHTEYGIDLIKVLDKQTAHVETFDEVKDQIRAQLEKEKFADAQTQFANHLGRQLQSNPQRFAALAAQAGLEVKETPLFRYKQVVPDFGNSESFADLAFQLRPGEVGQPFTVPKGTAIIQLVQSIPEHVPPFQDIRAQVEEDYRAAQAPAVAGKKAEQFAAQAKKGDFKAVARSMGLTVSESKDFTEQAQDYVPGLGPGSALADAFTLSIGQTSGVVKVGNNRVVFSVLARTPANQADFAAQKDQIAGQLVEQKRELAFELYEQSLKQELLRSGELKINDAVMKQFLASYQRS
jgi:peptidyl-prolyl cis-trans isomerase D